ncbi:MAG: purine-nucleoside phosphorylase [Synergistaceae bacterium]|nr:purine-nucleoside phosphorylase [Synergistaceae bacterium]MBQ6981840.1 purine-nucleoside phosphorylase [Synergistaceae bacterium]MBR0185642.1 purine-nucleoside phosphorylase [Synergistaceae bacterium]
MSNYDYEDAQETLAYIQKLLPFNPEFAITSGSGLGDIAALVENPVTLSAEDVPHWPTSTAPGHSGKIIVGKIHGRQAILLQGRVHYYEGYSLKAVTFPVRVLAMLGVKEYIATNASGAVNTSYTPGEIIAVKDHINLMGDNPLLGPNESRWNERFPDMSHAYDAGMLKIFADLGLKTGIYAAMSGPSFETPAEIRMLRLLGADVVGMSTVPEVIVANAMGMRVAVLSCVANMAAGVDPNHTLSAQEVLDAMFQSTHKLQTVLTYATNSSYLEK